jgi:ethanolamine permease
MVAGALLGYAAALVIHFSAHDSPVGAILLNMAVFEAVIAYVLQVASFLLLRWRFPELTRPYRSPLGQPGAWVSAGISLLVLGMLLRAAESNRGLIGAAVWITVGLLYFAFYARKRLILAPEERFAEQQK